MQKSRTLSRSERTALNKLIEADPALWIERYFYVPDPRDPITGEFLPPGPLRLHPLHKRILRHALLKDDRGFFRYSTILFSTIKKSGKTTIGAAMTAWFAATQSPYSEVYCLANDGKQSADRILNTIQEAIDLSPYLDWYSTKLRITLPNKTFIEAIPADAKGSAGAQPSLTTFSEIWGYTTDQKKKLWSEMTIPPTRFGKALRWVESYAGYRQESEVLWNLYEQGVLNGTPHPAFQDAPVYVNKDARMFTYWDSGEEARRMPWQQGEEGIAYYKEQAKLLVTEEFDRLHKNLWVEPITKAIPIEWWDACEQRIPPLDSRTPCVAGVDASVSGACTACVLVSLAPSEPDDPPHKKRIYVRAVRIWAPQGGKIDLGETVGKTLKEWHERYNLKMVVYDEYQLHHLMTELRREKKILVRAFGQTSPRLVADKALYDMIVHKEMYHSGNETLRQHVDHAQKKSTNESKMRFVSLDDSHPIDGIVALSMAAYQMSKLIL